RRAPRGRRPRHPPDGVRRGSRPQQREPDGRAAPPHRRRFPAAPAVPGRRAAAQCAGQAATRGARRPSRRGEPAPGCSGGSSVTAAPLVRGYRARSVFAHRDGRTVSIEEYLRDVREVAATLPDRRHVLNVCVDRYRFAVGFGAALLRQQLSLLPPNLTPDLIARLVSQYPDAYCLSDQATGPVGIETVPFRQTAGGEAAASPVPDVQEKQAAAIIFT